MALDRDQLYVLEMIRKAGYNIFLTGEAGTGKSKVLEAIHRF